ncbi:hypothetical protein DSUL_20180 [Desulfovibrionales bacterium]
MRKNFGILAHSALLDWAAMLLAYGFDIVLNANDTVFLVFLA